MSATPASTTARDNERVKLLATALNNLALAFVVAGFVAPVVSRSVPDDSSALLTIAWLFLGIFLHCAGLIVLGKIR